MNHFSTEWTEINNLDPELYEFKTIGKNTVGTSPESDVTEARPVIGPDVGKWLKFSPRLRTKLVLKCHMIFNQSWFPLFLSTRVTLYQMR